MKLGMFGRRIAATLLALTVAGGLAVATADSASAVTNPDRAACDDHSAAVPPGLWVRDPNNLATEVLYLTHYGYAGSQDHFYIEGEFYHGTAHWYVGYGYDVDNGLKRYGAVLDNWIAASTGGCW
ncbi:MAG TPA: hypothetical protein VH298_11620 [Jatrophihabitans sp.]|jgi:hypothetical protein|nr:hypothetical protein [Jatrophihabitans sp.]